MKVLAVIVLCLVVVAAVQAQNEANAQVRSNLITPQFVGVKPPVLINSAIIGGSSAAQNQFPYMVAVHQDNAYFCGGTLITKRYVLTAAHCAFNTTSCGPTPPRVALVRLPKTSDATNSVTFAGKLATA
ncbi:hypothetical protein B566_EDAN004158, partial [Ephemera danica]